MRLAVVALLALALPSCKLLERKTDAGAADAAAPLAAPEPEPTTKMVEPKDLPLGHWETTEGSKLCLTILPDGLVRFATEVPLYRNPARVFGQVTHAESDTPDSFRIWVDVSRILAKEIGPCHRHWTDMELYEAVILDQRVTSPNVDAQKIPQLGGGGNAPPRGYTLTFDKPRENLELCTIAREPKCRHLVRKKSPSDLSRVRTNGLCTFDGDCTVVTDGEQCDPCLCPSKASLKTWPRPRKPDDTHEDNSWEYTQEHMCGKSLPRKPDCPACPEVHAVCKNKACVLRGSP